MPLVASGLIGDHSGPVLAVSPEEARGASYLPASNVLRLPDGRLRYLPPGAAEAVTVPPDDPGAAEAAAASRAWLAAGTVPGGDAVERAISERAPRPAPAHASERRGPGWFAPPLAQRLAAGRELRGRGLRRNRPPRRVLPGPLLPRSRPGTGRDMGGPLRRRRDPGARRAYPAARRHGLVPLGYLVLVRYRGRGERSAQGRCGPPRAPRPTRRRPRSGPTVCRPAARTTGRSRPGGRTSARPLP